MFKCVIGKQSSNLLLMLLSVWIKSSEFSVEENKILIKFKCYQFSLTSLYMVYWILGMAQIKLCLFDLCLFVLNMSDNG